MATGGFDGARVVASLDGSGFSHNEAQGFGGGVTFQDIVSVNILNTTSYSNKISVLGIGIRLLVKMCCFQYFSLLKLHITTFKSCVIS